MTSKKDKFKWDEADRMLAILLRNGDTKVGDLAVVKHSEACMKRGEYGECICRAPITLNGMTGIIMHDYAHSHGGHNYQLLQFNEKVIREDGSVGPMLNGYGWYIRYECLSVVKVRSEDERHDKT